MSDDTDHDNNNDGLYDCSVCYLQIVNPTTLVCGHMFCRNCILEYIRTTQLGRVCPTCKHPISRPIPKVNYQLRNIIAHFNNHNENKTQVAEEEEEDAYEVKREEEEARQLAQMELDQKQLQMNREAEAARIYANLPFAYRVCEALNKQQINYMQFILLIVMFMYAYTNGRSIYREQGVTSDMSFEEAEQFRMTQDTSVWYEYCKEKQKSNDTMWSDTTPIQLSLFASLIDHIASIHEEELQQCKQELHFKTPIWSIQTFLDIYIDRFHYVFSWYFPCLSSFSMLFQSPFLMDYIRPHLFGTSFYYLLFPRMCAWSHLAYYYVRRNPIFMLFYLSASIDADVLFWQKISHVCIHTALETLWGLLLLLSIHLVTAYVVGFYTWTLFVPYMTSSSLGMSVIIVITEILASLLFYAKRAQSAFRHATQRP